MGARAAGALCVGDSRAAGAAALLCLRDNIWLAPPLHTQNFFDTRDFFLLHRVAVKLCLSWASAQSPAPTQMNNVERRKTPTPEPPA